MTLPQREMLPGFEPVESPTLPLLERLHILKATAGFLPTTRGEVNEALALLDYLHKPGKTAAHLNEILLHQLKEGTKTADP